MIVTVSTVLPVPVEKVWARLDDFGQWHTWIPRIESTTMADGLDQAPIGSVRILTRGDGTSIRERLMDKDSQDRTLSYEFDGPHPYPVRRYLGRVHVEPVTTDDTTFIRWSGDFDADADAEPAAAELFAKIYHSFFVALADALT